MKNSLHDLNNHLFAAIERLSNESISKDELAVEIARSKAIADVSKTLIESGKLMLEANMALEQGQFSEGFQMPDLLKNKQVPRLISAKK